jgi:Zn-dependent protease
MFRSFTLGRLAGFPIRVNGSFLLLAALVPLLGGGLASLWFLALVIVSIVVHELGHALVARRLGVPMDGIELHFFGGAARMLGQPRSPGDEIAIAAAGPAVSFAAGGLSLALAALTASPLATLMAEINLVLGLFNLIPALPMDGGRILRALLERRLGHLRATRTAVAVARVVAALFVVGGLAMGQIMLPILGVVLWAMGTQERRAAEERAALEALAREAAATPWPFVVVRRFSAWG